jgi:cyanosortase A-associated protein
MKHQLSFRGSLLALTLGGALLACGKVVLFPAPTHSTTVSFTFPTQVPLPEWQAVTHKTLTSQDVGASKHLGGIQYQYTKSGIPLEIEMHYFDNTNGDVGDFLKAQKSIARMQTNQQKHSAAGYYSLFVHQDKAYLSACINPYGGSTVTSKQFKKNRNTHDIPNRLVPWLLGQGRLQDERCFWAHLSVPLGRSSPEAAYQNLESVWTPWSQWWNQHFPRA